MFSRHLVIESGNCVGADYELFDNPETVAESKESCAVCPALELCANRIGPIAMALNNPYIPNTVIAGQEVRWSVERPYGPLIGYAPLPDDNQQALEHLRGYFLGVKLSNTLPRNLDPQIAALKVSFVEANNDICTELGRHFDEGWSVFAKALSRYRASGRAVLEDRRRFEALATSYFMDVQTLRSFGLVRAGRDAIRHSPDYFRELYAKYVGHPDVTNSVINVAATNDIHYPDCAVKDYLLRIDLMRSHFAGQGIPDFIMRKVTLYHPLNCFNEVERCKNVFYELQNTPRYGGRYHPTVLWHASLLSAPAARSRAINSVDSLFNSTRSLRLDDYRSGSEGGTTSRHELHANPNDIGVEDQVVNRDSILDLLENLSAPERAAVIFTFGLDGFDVEGDGLTEHEIRKKLGIKDIETHVKINILPKLRAVTAGQI